LARGTTIITITTTITPRKPRREKRTAMGRAQRGSFVGGRGVSLR
jgi:hypothetical protein